MTTLKLIAFDSEDLDIVGAHLQDAVVRVGDLAFLPHQHRFVGLFNRFAWETAQSKTPERRRAGFRVEGVRSAKRLGLNQNNPDAVLNLLDIRFQPEGLPSGTIELTFSGGGVIRLEVDYIEVALHDTGATWAASNVPRHALPDDGAS